MGKIIPEKRPVADLYAMFAAIGHDASRVVPGTVVTKMLYVQFDEYVYESDGQGGRRKKRIGGIPLRHTVCIKFESEPLAA